MRGSISGVRDLSRSVPQERFLRHRNLVGLNSSLVRALVQPPYDLIIIGGTGISTRQDPMTFLISYTDTDYSSSCNQGIF